MTTGPTIEHKPADSAPAVAAAPTLAPPAIPLLRGWIHAGAFLLSIPLGVALLILARPAEARAAAAIYAATLVIGFGTSAAYHRLARGPAARTWMRRADHSTIYLLIAGTYTPICLLVLPPAWGVPVLAVVWVGAAVGVALKLFAFDHSSGVGWALYLILGWTAVVAAPVLFDHLTGLELALIIAGGILYTVGSLVLARRRPNPSPRIFGYHEVWHVFTVLAGLCHFAAVGLVVAAFS